MKHLKFLKSNQKKKILEELEEEYGIKKLPYLLLETGKMKHRAYSGSLSREEIGELNKAVNIEVIGLYLAAKKDTDIRLNFDTLGILKDQITKNILEINEEQFELWIRGHDLDISFPRGSVIVKYEGDLIGVGKSNTEKIFNYTPKERKLKTPLKN